MSVSISKRNFLRGSLATLATLPVAGVGAIELKKNQTIRWDKECDVLVVGYGGAGACAAISAHDAGAKVLIIEKMAQGGGNTAVSSGGFMIPDSEADAFTYLSKTFEYADSEMDEGLVKTFCKKSMESKAFMESLDPNVKLFVYGHAGFQSLPGADTIKKYRIRGKKQGGDCLFDTYIKAVETDRKIPVLFNTPALELITKEREIIGVLAQNEGKSINIRANRAVILSTGGFEYDPESLKTYCQGTKITGLGSPGNTGDGLRMAQTAGAKLWHMTAYSCPLGVKVPGLVSSLQVNMLAPSHIWVDQDGKRFINEKGLDNHTCLYAVNTMDPIKHRYPKIPCYLIFDEEARKAGPIIGGAKSGFALNRENYKWSKDNSVEINNGVIIKADTLEELAKKINVPTDALKSSVAKWNEDVKAGGDTLFGRRLKKDANAKSTFAGREAPILSAPIAEQGPYYATALYPAMLNTQGGPKRNAQGQALDGQGQPIPRLYVAGELGSIWGSIYQGATNNAECIVFGRLAGSSAAAEKPWA